MDYIIAFCLDKLSFFNISTQPIAHFIPVMCRINCLVRIPSD